MKIIRLALATLLAAVVMLVPAVALAADTNIAGELCAGANIDSPNSSSNCETGSGGSVQTLASDVINIFSWVVGIVSVIMIIYGGFRYITSAGNDSSVTSAKNTILYAIIGLVVVAISQILVKFVIAKFSSY